ncbi:MAG: hypothetical protein CMM93_05515 [Rickettsiales bacterium]|nr:hypothetical protein [Rickettsiales bacterium]|tara:strand:- start:153 stop:857 length:705 start_codon:yes stop_codon:yes gene_type:complete
MVDYNTLPADLQPPTRGEKIAESLRSAGHKVAATPLLSLLGIGTLLTAAATVVDTVDGFISKSFSDGVRNGVSGAVDTAATSVVGASGLLSIALYPVNWMVTLSNPNMDSIPELLRKGTDSVLKNILPASKGLPQMDPVQMASARNAAMFGAAPAMPLATAPAGVGYAQGLPQPQIGLPSNPAANMPENYWTDRTSQQRGQDAQQMRESFTKGNMEEVRAYHAANRDQQQLGAS